MDSWVSYRIAVGKSINRRSNHTFLTGINNIMLKVHMKNSDARVIFFPFVDLIWFYLHVDSGCKPTRIMTRTKVRSSRTWKDMLVRIFSVFIPLGPFNKEGSHVKDCSIIEFQDTLSCLSNEFHFSWFILIQADEKVLVDYSVYPLVYCERYCFEIYNKFDLPLPISMSSGFFSRYCKMIGERSSNPPPLQP